MPPSSSSVQAARQRLGSKLRELRLGAELTGRAFAAAAGCQASKVSQIEKGVRPASVADVRLWCRVCGASAQQQEELLTEQAAVAQLWIAFRDLDRRTGLNATQKMLSGDMWERVQVHRAYQTKLIHGLLQTTAYMTGILTEVRRERRVAVDDVAEAVAERIGRQGYLLHRERQFRFVFEEPVLWFRPFSIAVQRAQLVHLLDMMTLPTVTVGIIPMAADRRGYRPRESFEITDTSLVTIEMLSGFLSLTHREEVSAYVQAWEELDSIAVHHGEARVLVRHALAALDEIPAGREAPQ